MPCNYLNCILSLTGTLVTMPFLKELNYTVFNVLIGTGAVVAERADVQPVEKA